MDDIRDIEKKTAPGETGRKAWTAPALTIVTMSVADTKGSPGNGADLGVTNYNATS